MREGEEGWRKREGGRKGGGREREGEGGERDGERREEHVMMAAAGSKSVKLTVDSLSGWIDNR